MMTHRKLAGLIAAVSMTAVVAACSGGGGSDGGSDMAQSGESLADASSSGATSGDVRSLADAPAEHAADTGSADEAARPQERAVISKGTVSLVASDVRTARQDVQRVLDTFDAVVGEEQTETDEDGDLSYARLVIRVPAKSFAATMTALEGVAEFRTSNRGSEDVTTEVIDNEVRVRAQQASLKRVETLLSSADSLKDIIWIESQLTQRQAELDSLKSQQAWLTDQTSLSTITLDLAVKQDRQKVEKQDDDGFLAGLAGGWKALSGTATALATVVGALLPFAVVGLVLGLPLWLAVRRTRARRRTSNAGGASV